MQDRLVTKRFAAITLGTLLLVSLVALSGMVPVPRANGGGGDPVTITHHVDLGFTSTIPLNFSTGQVCDFSFFGCIFSHNMSFTGSAIIKLDLAADVALTYDPSLLVPGGSLPVTVTYTPTPGGSTASFDVAANEPSGNLSLNFSFCNDCPFVTSFTVASGSAAFTAPLGSDTPITIPASGSTINFGNVLSASIDSSITLGPVPADIFSGLGGAAALVSVSGASTSQALPIEWDSSGASQTFTLNLPSTLQPIDISLGPMVHWLNASGSVAVKLNWGSIVNSIYALNVVPACLASPFPPACIAAAGTTAPDPSPITVYSGSLGNFTKAAGLDTTISNAVSSAVGGSLGTTLGNDIAAKIDKGELPIPLLSPPLANFPPLPSLGTVDFSIPFASISGAPSGAILAGNFLTLNALTAGGTAPFNYAWTMNGVPIGGNTPSITGVPPLGTTTFGVTVTDSLGAVSNTATTTVNVYDFALGVSPPSLTVLTTGYNTYSPGVAESLLSGSATVDLPTLSLSATGLPTGATASFVPGSGSATGFGSLLNITTSGAAAGTYTLTVVGTDSTTFGGTRSATATLVVETPAQALPSIINSIKGFQLTAGQANSLIAKLNHAITTLNAGSQLTACNQLSAFVNEVNSYVAEGILTQAQANQLLNPPLGVHAIMAAIPC